MQMPDDEIVDRLSWVEARLELLELESRYSHLWDSGDGSGWAALFSKDGVFERADGSESSSDMAQGRAALAQRCAEAHSQHASLHFLHLPDLRVEGSRATGWMNFQFLAINLVGGEVSQTMGFHEVIYVKDPDGWLIDHRTERCLYRRVHGSYAAQFYAQVLSQRQLKANDPGPRPMGPAL
jgi:SnoaL-like domain